MRRTGFSRVPHGVDRLKRPRSRQTAVDETPGIIPDSQLIRHESDFPDISILSAAAVAVEKTAPVHLPAGWPSKGRIEFHRIKWVGKRMGRSR